jgi:integrase
MPRISLSDAFVERCRGQTGARLHFLDTRIPGLQLEVSSRSKRFVLRSRGDYVTLGRWPLIDVSDARRLALDRLRQQFDVVIEKPNEPPKVASHASPSPTKKRPTLAALLDEYVKVKAPSARTAQDYKTLLARYWGDYCHRPLDLLGPDQFLERFRSIQSPSQANHSLRTIRALFRYFNAAHDDQLPVPTTKALAVDGAHYIAPRSRMVSQGQQRAWLASVDKMAGPTARDLFELLALTGLRQGEALAISWDQVDLQGGILSLPKTKNGRPHSIPLGKRAVALLTARKAVSPDKVFAISVRNVRFSVARVVNHSNIAWSCHDLRRGFATAATRLQVPHRAVKRLLNHTEKDVTGQHYVWLDVEDVRPYAQAIEDYFCEKWRPKTIEPYEASR